jgi:adenine deaminase
MSTGLVDLQNTNVPNRRTVLVGGSVLASGLASSPALAQSAADAAPTADRLKSASRLLFKGGTILTMDRQFGDFAKGDLLVENGRIAAVRPDLGPVTDAVVIDATNRILLPGFVDTHSHSYQGLLRGTLPNGVVLPDYDRDIQKNITAHYTAEDVYAGVLITALGMLDPTSARRR